LILNIGIGEFMSGESYIDTYENYSKNVMAYRDKAAEYVERLNGCLGQKTLRSVIDFIDIATQDEVRSHCILANRKLYYAVIISLILAEETKRRRTYYFTFNANSLDELVSIFKQVEFSLWELEFDGGEQAEQRFYDTVCSYGITPEAVYCVISFASKNKNETIDKAAKIYSAHGLEWTM
jgi:hypothetical protein